MSSRRCQDAGYGLAVQLRLALHHPGQARARLGLVTHRDRATTPRRCIFTTHSQLGGPSCSGAGDGSNAKASWPCLLLTRFSAVAPAAWFADRHLLARGTAKRRRCRSARSIAPPRSIARCGASASGPRRLRRSATCLIALCAGAILAAAFRPLSKLPLARALPFTPRASWAGGSAFSSCVAA